MKISKRQKKILWYIFEHKNETLERIAKHLKMSPKTLSKEIVKLNIFFKPYETSIILKDKKGIKIDSIYPQVDLISIINENQQLSSSDEVKLYLLLSKSTIKASEIEEKFYISRPTINKIIKSIETDYKIIKESGNIKLELDNASKIAYSLNLILNYIDTINYRVTFKNVIKHLGFAWEENWYTLEILDYIKDKDVDYTDQSLINFYIVKNLTFYLGDTAYDVDAVLKIKDGVKLNFNDENVNKILEICILKLQDFLNVSKEDLYFLVNHLVVISKKQHNYKQNEIYIYLKYLEEFKVRYPLTLNIAQNILLEVNDTMKITLDEYEKYFIALHIQVLFDNNKKLNIKKVLIVCEYGIGLSNFLKARLEQKINLELDIKTSSSARYSVDKESYKGYHLILTTILNLKSNYNTVIHISPFLIDSEILEIQHFLERIESFLTLKDILKEENLIFDNTIKTRTDALLFLEEKIKDKISDGYMESLIKRDSQEQIPLNKMIFPHGNPTLVNVSSIFIIVLETEINWNGKWVRLIIFNCLSQSFMDNNTQFIKYFYRMLVNDANILKILDYNNQKDAYFKLINEIKESND